VPIDSKYGRVTLENPRHVAEDEPVIVFVAHDRLVPKLLKVYRYFCELAGSPTNHLLAIDAAAAEIKAWQRDHPEVVKVPRSEGLNVGPICPECRDNKHDNCDSTAWDDDRDRKVRCACYAREHV